MNRMFFLGFLIVSFNSIHETEEMYRAGQGCKHVLKQLGKDFISNELQNTGNSLIKKGGTTMAPPTTRYKRQLSEPSTPFCARRYSADGISETVSSLRRPSITEEVEKRGICAGKPHKPLKKSHTCASFFDQRPLPPIPSQSAEEGGLVYCGCHHHPSPSHHHHHHHHNHHHGHGPCPSVRVVVHEQSVIYE